MPAETAPTQRLPTGGPPQARLDRKRWWQQLARRFDGALARTVAEDVLDRRPAALVVGARQDDWRAWLQARGADTAAPRVGLAIAVDALAPLAVPEARTAVADLHRRVVVGGRLVLVERVVRRTGQDVRGITDLLSIVSAATGGAVTLADVAAVTRPGEPHPSTVVLELLRLALPEDS